MTSILMTIGSDVLRGPNEEEMGVRGEEN